MESEIKLRLNNREQAEYIQNDDWFEDFAPHEPEVLSMRTTYLDTPDADLRKNQVMLRMREEGDVQVVTCKIGTMKGEDGFYQHLEWNLTLDEALKERIREEGLQDVFMDMADGDGDDELNAALRPYRTVNLVPVVEAAFERTAYDALFGESLLEIVFDVGQFIVDGKPSEPICEVEIELKEGDVTDLLDFGRLFQTHFDLKPENLSKYQRALALLP